MRGTKSSLLCFWIEVIRYEMENQTILMVNFFLQYVRWKLGDQTLDRG